MVSMFSFSVPLDKKDTIHTAQQVSSVALFVHGCDIAGNLAALGHRAVNECSAPLSALAAAKNSRVHGSCTYSATLTAPRAVAMPTAPAVPVAPQMHAAPCLEPRSVAAPTSSLSTPRVVQHRSPPSQPRRIHACTVPARTAQHSPRHARSLCQPRPPCRSRPKCMPHRASSRAAWLHPLPR